MIRKKFDRKKQNTIPFTSSVYHQVNNKKVKFSKRVQSTIYKKIKEGQLGTFLMQNTFLLHVAI